MTALKTRTLGKSGIQATEIGMGLWAAGGDQWGPTDDQAVLDAIDSALDAGITFFDTADGYGSGHSEDLVSQAMHGEPLTPSSAPIEKPERTRQQSDHALSASLAPERSR